jgi:hypothetical protein
LIPSVLWRADEHEELTTSAWDERAARESIEAIVSDAEGAERDGFWPAHPLDEVGDQERFCSLYLGSGGVIWGLWKLGASFDAAAAIGRALEHYRAAPDLGPDAHPPSLVMGEAGLLVAADRLGSLLADRQRLGELVHENRAHPTWEFLWGSPGTMIAARACGLSAAWEESAALLWDAWDEGSDLWTQDMYGQVTQYLGAGHGFAGNVPVLRGFVDDQALQTRVAGLLERTADRADGLVNWPPLPGAGPEQIRVQWCHGAPGILISVGDLLPHEMALGAGELVWRAGPLRKGPGLCHGTAGNGYAFLRLHQLTGDELWLDRARRFAMHATQQVVRHRAEVGRGRYTLWTGDIGVALFVQACLDADAAFPTIDVF